MQSKKQCRVWQSPIFVLNRDVKLPNDYMHCVQTYTLPCRMPWFILIVEDNIANEKHSSDSFKLLHHTSRNALIRLLMSSREHLR